MDNTAEIALEYKKIDKRIIVLSQNNKGLSGARNTGINYARGSYIGFVDSDDWIPAAYYETLLNILLKTGADVATTDFLRVKSQKEIKQISEIKTDVITGKEILHNYMLSGVQGKSERIAVCSKLYKRSAIGGNRFEEGRIYEDIDFNWYVYKNSKRVALVSGVYYYYYINVASITKNSFSNSAYDLIHAADVIVNDFSWEDKELKKMIEQYRARADFSVLIRMIIGDCKDSKLIKNQQHIVNKSFKLLISSEMPHSRKLALILFKLLPTNLILKARKCL